MTQLRDGSSTQDPRLDRIKQFDERSRNYTVREHLATVRRRRRKIRPGPTLDQGQEGACVGFSSTQAAMSLPFHKGPFDNSYAREWYFKAQRDDEWEGGEYPGAVPQYGGSSVLGGMKAGLDLGIWTSYRWIGAGSGTPIDDAVEALRYVGPVVFGIDWPDSAFHPDPDSGVIKLDRSSGIAGGHAICGVDATHLKPPGHSYQLWIILLNSWNGWGTDLSWSRIGYRGQSGFCLVDPVELEDFLDGAEGAVPLR